DLARALAAQNAWRGQPPILFFMTATASEIKDPDTDSIMPVDLMQVYADRSFRMCFTNEQIASAVVDFVWSQPTLRSLPDTMALHLIGSERIISKAIGENLVGFDPLSALTRVGA